MAKDQGGGFHKVIRVGQTDRGSVFCKIEYELRDKWRLSISGVEGPLRNGDCRGSGGQIVDVVLRIIQMREDHSATFALAEGWTTELVERFCAVWKRWHLNDMRPGCEHQRDWDVQKVLELRLLTWGADFHKLRKRAMNGELSTEDYEAYKVIASDVARLTMIFPEPKHPDLWGARGAELLRDGLLKEDRKESKAAGWVKPSEHPEGLLARPCDVCGYKYGTAWLYEPVPEEVLGFLRSLPEADCQPAWV